MRGIPFSGRTELAKAAVHRKLDAMSLLKEQRWRGAMYLAGYALECKLKVQLMERYQCFHLTALEDEIERRTGEQPALSTVRGHNLEYLLGFAQCLERLRQNRSMYQRYLVCNRWDHRWRYAGDPGSEEQAAYFLECVDEFYRWLSSNI